MTISERKLQCDVCEKCFKTENKLKRHEFQHKDPSEYPHECDICKKKFIEITKLKQHTRKHHKAADAPIIPHVRFITVDEEATNETGQGEENKYEFLE